MRVLVAGAHWELIGGSERHTRDVSRALAQAGHEVCVLVDSDPTTTFDNQDQRQAAVSDDDRSEAGLQLFQVSGCATAAPLESSTQCEVNEILARFRPQVILILVARNAQLLSQLTAAAPVVRLVQDHVPFCPGGNKTLLSGTPCRRPAGARCLVTALMGSGCAGLRKTSGPAWRRTVSQWRRTAEDLKALRNAPFLLVASDYMAGELVAVGCRPEQITTLPYFTNSGPPEVRQREASDRTSPAPPRILTPARLTLPDKGVDYLLTALGQVRLPFHATICGEGPARAWLEHKAREEGLAQRVQFAGWCSDREMEQHYGAADVAAIPSMWDEPFGIVGIEAMAHGLPVVAFDVGGICSWLRSGETGTSVPRGETAAFAAALDELLGDVDLRRRYGTAAQALVAAEYRAPQHLAALESILERAAETGC
ncbi:MAG: glycosyltransferase family 4 protein [Planctomycetota bacterium]|nr:glycosyltransferase family 4 protein [Planctomycetota bacterium]MDP6837341.1 glycosyltransferase family 4 protein [Planctomycetota bacterium]